MSQNRGPRKKATLQDIQQFHKSLSSFLNQITNYNKSQNQNQQNDPYDYIKKRLKSDIKHYLLSFQPDNQQYQAFTEIYIKSTQLIIKFIVNCPNQYYKELLFCLNALLGFAESPFQCEIFTRPNYKNQPKQGVNYKHVQQSLPSTNQQNPYQSNRYNKRGKNKFNDQYSMNMNSMSHTQLACIDEFYDNIKYFTKHISNNMRMSKFGVFDFQKMLIILYNAGKNAQLQITNTIYGQSLHRMINSWVNNLDDTSFEQQSIGDDLSNFQKLFSSLEEMYDKYIKQKSSNHVRVDQDLLNIKLLFCHKLLQCNKMERRVQALSLMKIVLEKARSDDNKHKNNNETSEWSTKSHGRKHRHGNQWNNSQHPFQNGQNNNNQQQSDHDNQKQSLRDRCSKFILSQRLLDLLMSKNYIHENLLQRLQPIIDVLCDTKKMSIDLLKQLFKASEDKHSIELTQFNKLYLSLSKQLDNKLCRDFYETIIHDRFQYNLKPQNQIEESHLEFIARYTNNYIDKTKAYRFKGIEFLKQYGIGFDDNNISSLHLRQFAFKKLEGLYQKTSGKNLVKNFVVEAFTNMSQYIQKEFHFNSTQSNLNQNRRNTASGVDPIDMTYVIDGIDHLLKIKNVARANEDSYNFVADRLINDDNIRCREWHDLAVTEMAYWFRNCSSKGFENIKRWRSECKRSLSIRLALIKIVAQKTRYPIRDDHVQRISKIPNETKQFYNMPQNETFREKLNEIYHQEFKRWLNECVKLNKSIEIFESAAISSIFNQQFDQNMDMNGFKSWLAYFHDLNKATYNLQQNEYYPVNANQIEKAIEGYHHMRKVIENNTRMDVVVAMIDELIQLHHAQGKHHGDLHVPISDGISNLLDKCHKEFKQYNNVMGYNNSNDNFNSRHELRVMRYTLLLRRIIEFSMGKQTKTDSNKKSKYQIIFTKIETRHNNNRYNNGNNSQYQQRGKQASKPITIEVECPPNTDITDIRQKIAIKLNYNDQPRAIQLFRKYENKFVMIEEHHLKYLTYYDLAIKKKIELEVRIISSNTTQHRSGYSSFSEHYSAVWDNFIELQRLLSSQFFTTALSAYYALRYLPISRSFRDDMLAKCRSQTKQFFDINRPIMNIYNIDVLKHYADMKCVTNEEQQQKEKTIKNMYNKDVSAVLFELFTDFTYDSDHHFSGIHRLLWIEQFNRLCKFFYDIKVDSKLFGARGSNNNNRLFRPISNFYGASDLILRSLINALNILLTSNIPAANLPLFDMTSTKHVENTISQTITKCFTIAVFIIQNKQSYFEYLGKQSKGKNSGSVQQDLLENIYIQGLEQMNMLDKVVFSGKLPVRTAFYEGIRRFMEHQPNQRFIQRILGLLVRIIPTNVNNDTRHCSRFFTLLTNLINKDPKSTQKFIPIILEYVFEKLRSLPSPKKKDDLISLLECADKLYNQLNPSNQTNSEQIESHIHLLTAKCLFGDIGNNTKININSQVLLCPSGTPQRQIAFRLLFNIINRYESIGKIQTKILQNLLKSLGDHLHITSHEIVVPDDNDEDEQDEKKQHNNNHPDNKRKDFVGLVNLGCTCYLNSILQQLFMVPSFTNEMLSIQSNVPFIPNPSTQTPGNMTTPGNNGINGQLLHQLQRVLLALRESQKKYFNPKDFCSTVNNSEGNPIDVWEQTDCQESLVALLHQLEHNLKQIPSARFGKDEDTLLDEHFGCKLRYLVKCANGHVTKRDEKHMSLALSVKDTPNIHDAFDKFTEAEVLDGDNKYQCSSCNRKVPAVRRQTIYKPPKQLILCLKRFEWNFETGGRQKLNTRFEFEPVINIKQYLNTNFPEEETDDEAESKYSDDTNTPNGDDEYIYDLVGIVIHQGQADRGHYYAYIKDRNTFINSNNPQREQWYEFNDKNVCKREYNYIQKEAFGGATTVRIDEESKQNNYQRNNRQNNPWNKKNINQPKQQSVEILSERNAYVLFYEQRAVKNEQRKRMRQQQKEEAKSNEIDMQQPWKNVNYLSAEYVKINNENINIFRQQTLYDEQFVAFMKNIYQKLLDDRESMQISADTKKVLIRFVFNVVPIECRDNNEVKWWWDRLTQAVDCFNDTELHKFINSKVLPAYLMNIFGKYTNSHNRKAAVSFFEHVIKNIAKRNNNNNVDLNDKLLFALIKVIREWKPRVLHPDMSDIIDLINCINNIDPKYFNKYSGDLIDALKQLIIKDFDYSKTVDQNVPDAVVIDLADSETNLNMRSINGLIFSLIQHNTKNNSNDNTIVKKLNDRQFLKVLISRNYDVSQVKIVKYICDNSSIKTFEEIVKLIHLRMAWLDFYEVFGALNIFNGLFDDPNDQKLSEKLQTNCLRTHLQKINQQNRYWKFSQVAILLLAHLCKNNLLVRSWIQSSCYGELEQLGKWCQRNKKFSNKQNNRNNRNNRNYNNQYNNQPNILFYRFEPEFHDNDAKQRKKRWSNKVNNKISLNHLDNPNDIKRAFDTINKRD